jgi:hypothetical protein
VIIRDKLTIVHHVVEEVKGMLSASATALLALGHDADVHVGHIGHSNVLALGLHVELPKGTICNQSSVLDVDVAGSRRVLNTQVATEEGSVRGSR